MKRGMMAVLTLVFIFMALICTVQAEENGLAGTLKQAGIDAEALYADAPIIGDVTVGEGILSFFVGDVSGIYLDMYDASGETAAQFGIDDFTCEDGVWTVRSEAIDTELEFDIEVDSATGFGQYTSQSGQALAWVAEDTICLYDDGTVMVWADEDIALVYGKDGRLTGYSFTEDDLRYTYSVSGQLQAMSGEVQDLGTVSWSAEDGWYIWDVEGDEDQWVRMTEEQIKVALPYAKYAQPKDVDWERQWYPNNTACVIGLSLRDQWPELTDKWYHVLPVRVDQEGRQEFPLVASNLYIVGKVTVTVRNDWVTVTYKYLGLGDEIQRQSDTVAWFTSMDQLTPEYLEDPVSNCRFGKRISRKKDLNGQSVALLFVCNRVTYAQPFDEKGVLLTRYWPNHPRYVKYREALNGLLAEMTE